MNYTDSEIEALAGLATSSNSQDWDLFNQYPASIKLKTIDAIISIINKSSLRLVEGAYFSSVTSFLALGLEVEFDIHTKINFIELRKCRKIIHIIEDNAALAMELIYIELLKIITND